MVEKAYRAAWDAEMPPFGIQDLFRLAIWGGLAAAALFLAVLSSYSGAVSPRPPVASGTGQGSALQKTSAADTPARSADTMDEIQGLTEAVHALTADREHILSRIASLERSLDDITGSIKRDAQHALPQITSTSSAASPGQTEVPAASPTKTAIIPPQAPLSQQPGSIEAAVPGSAPDNAPRAAATPSAPMRTTTLAEPPVGAPGLGVDVGGAVNFDGLRTLWSSTKHNLPAMPDELYPVVAVRENGKTRGAELRLIVGPIVNTETAGRLCAALAAAHRYCQAVAFEGQRLSLIEPLSKPIPNTVHRSP